MQEKALTIGKVLVSVPAVIFRAASRFFLSLGADIVCFFMGPMHLYSHIKPEGKQWIAFVFRVIGLSIYNSIALALNATLGLLYNLVESAFMMYELWTQPNVTVKKLYCLGGKEENKEEDNKDISKNGDQVNQPVEVDFKLVAGLILGVFDIDNKMSQFVHTKVGASEMRKSLSNKFYSAAGKLMGMNHTEKNIPEIDAVLNPNHSFRAK